MFARYRIAGVGAVAATVIAVAATAQDFAKGLTPAQQRLALEIEAASKPPPSVMARATLAPAMPGMASTPAGRQGKSVRPLVVPLETAGKGGAAGHRAVVMRYDYATGVTTRTTVDLDSGKAVHVRQDANYPTPLAKEEYDQALELARKSSPEFDGIIKAAAPADLLITTQVPLYANRKHPRYGHRMVTLRIEAPAVSDRITVDLSTNEIVPDHH
jgi:hypothetical protein